MWRKDVRRAKERIGPGQVLIVSVVGTPFLAGGDAETLVADYARCAALGRRSGADAIEVHLATPDPFVRARPDGLRGRAAGSRRSLHRVRTTIGVRYWRSSARSGRRACSTRPRPGSRRGPRRLRPRQQHQPRRVLDDPERAPASRGRAARRATSWGAQTFGRLAPGHGDARLAKGGRVGPRSSGASVESATAERAHDLLRGRRCRAGGHRRALRSAARGSLPPDPRDRRRLTGARAAEARPGARRVCYATARALAHCRFPSSGHGLTGVDFADELRRLGHGRTFSVPQGQSALQGTGQPGPPTRAYILRSLERTCVNVASQSRSW